MKVIKVTVTSFIGRKRVVMSFLLHQIFQADSSEWLELPEFVTQHVAPRSPVLLKKLLKLNILRKIYQIVEKVTMCVSSYQSVAALDYDSILGQHQNGDIVLL
jgi:hypothetical protein